MSEFKSPVYYAGIGSRKTPADICELMQELGKQLALKDLVFRSGGAEKADISFEKGCDEVEGAKQIFYTNNWKERRGYTSLTRTWNYTPSLWTQAEVIASQYHPAWGYLKGYSRRLMTRNCFQVLGENLQKPAKFVICWTPDGAKDKTTPRSGGTGQAIRIANAMGIPVYNLANQDDLELTLKWLRK